MIRRIWMSIAITIMICAMTGCTGQWSNPGGGAGGGAGQGGGGGQGRNRPRASADEVKTAFKNVLQAFQKKDLEALDQMFAENSTVSAPALGGRVLMWKDAKPVIGQALQNSGDLQFSENNDAVIGVDRDMGWIAASYHVHEVRSNGANDNDGVMTLVFRKTEDGYKIIAFQAARTASPMGANPAKPEAAPATKK